MNQETRQDLLLGLLKKLKELNFESKKILANDLYLSTSELDDLLYDLIKERSVYVKTRTF
mgnify:CR=1 FL=1